MYGSDHPGPGRFQSTTNHYRCYCCYRSYGVDSRRNVRMQSHQAWLNAMKWHWYSNRRYEKEISETLIDGSFWIWNTHSLCSWFYTNTDFYGWRLSFIPTGFVWNEIQYKFQWLEIVVHSNRVRMEWNQHDLKWTYRCNYLSSTHHWKVTDCMLHFYELYPKFSCK